MKSLICTVLFVCVLFPVQQAQPQEQSRNSDTRRDQLLKELSDRVQYLEDMTAIQKLQSQYIQLLFTQDFDKIMDCCFARNLEDISVEFSDSGVYKGQESVTALYRNFEATRNAPGFFIMHLMVNPYIEIAADGMSAKSSWMSPGASASRSGGRWIWGPYYVDYVREDGQWRISRTHFVPIFRNRYETSWVEETDHGSVRDALSVEPDAPTTLYKPYDKNQADMFKEFPELPEPY